MPDSKALSRGDPLDPQRPDVACCRLGHRLTVAESRALCESVQKALQAGADTVVVDARHVSAVDAAGLAALRQCQDRAVTRGAGYTLWAGPPLIAHAIAAHLLDELVLERCGDVAESPPAVAGPPSPCVVVRSPRVLLRQPRPADAPLFQQWAADPFVEQMVGSDLLYRHRHLPAGDPAIATSILHDPRALTLVVERVADGSAAGFVRLYDIELVSRFGFLETVVIEARSARGGLGVEASRLLLAFGQDALQLRRVEAKVYAYNVLSINALKRNGFRQEGVLREARLYDGEPWDILVYSLLDREMAEQRAGLDIPDLRLFGSKEDDG